MNIPLIDPSGEDGLCIEQEKTRRILPPLNRDPLDIGMIENCSKTPLEDIADSLGFDPDILMAPEYFLTDGRIVDTRTRDKIIETIARLSETSDTLLIPGTISWTDGKYLRNTAYAFHKGKIVHRYNKQVDGGDNKMAIQAGLIWMPGEESPIFDWNGLDIGIRICADQSVRLNRLVDLEIVCARGNLTHADKFMMNEGPTSWTASWSWCWGASVSWPAR